MANQEQAPGHELTIRNAVKGDLVAKAIKRGEITLSSGAKSNFYIDCRSVILEPGPLRRLGKLLWGSIIDYRPTAVGGPETAAIALTASVVLASEDLRLKFNYCSIDGPETVLEDYRKRMFIYNSGLHGFYVRKATKEHGLQKLIEGWQPGPDDRVVLLEDVVTSGASLYKAMMAVRATGATVVAAACIVDRLAGGRDLDWGSTEFRSIFTIDELMPEG